MSKNYKKVGILIAILIVPTIFILFLREGTNHFEVKNFPDAEGNPGKSKYLLDLDETSIHYVKPFKFTDQEGKVVTEQVTKDKVTIVDYIFTRCQTICPRMSTQMERVQGAFKGNKDIVILSHTVDPDHDTAKVLKAYADAHHAVYGQWFFLTGKKEDLYRQASDSYRIVTSKESTGPDAFVHSDKMVLIDKKGRIRGFYSGTDSTKVDTLILETKIILTEQE